MSYDTLLQTALAPVSAHDDIDVVALEDIDVIMGYQETEAEVNALESALSHISRTALGLEALNAYVETAQEQGGMDAMAAGAVIAGADGMLSAFGGLQVVETMPTMESFEGDGGRVTATQVANEAITTTIKRLWEQFVEYLKKAQVALMKWLDEKISTAARLSKAAQNLAEKARSEAYADRTKMDKTTLPVRGGQYLRDSGGKVSKVSADDIKKLEAFAKDVIFNDKILKASLQIAKAVGDIDTKELKSEAAIASLRGAKSEYHDTLSSTLGLKKGGTNDKRLPKQGSNGTTNSVELPLGGAFIYSTRGENSIATLRLVGSANPESKEKLEAPALSAGDAAQVADAVASICDLIVDRKKSSRDGEKLNNDIVSNGKKVMGAVKDNDPDMTSEVRRTLTSLVEGMRQVNSNYNGLNRDAIKQVTQAAGAAYGFAKASLSNLKKDDK